MTGCPFRVNIMEFWDNFSKTVSDAAEYTVKEAGKLTGWAKLKYKLSASRARLDTFLAALGSVKYNEVKGAAADANVNELIRNIDALKAEIEAYENEIAKLKNVRICAACRQAIALDMAFCPRCGAKQPEPEEPNEECCCCCCDDDDYDCDCDDDECDCGCDDDCCDDKCDCGCDDDCCDDKCDCGCDDDSCDDKCDCGCDDDCCDDKCGCDDDCCDDDCGCGCGDER
mgnify:CR=1 FL=1